MGKKKHGRRRKSKTHVTPKEDPNNRVPRSFVVTHGRVGNTVREVRDNLRKVMEPNTAAHLQERKTNTMKDYQNIAATLGVSHMMVLRNTDVGTTLKLAKLPQGPTLSFRVHSYGLMREVVALQKNPHPPGHNAEYKTAPLVVLNNFPREEEHTKLMSIMFQNMFPALNIQTMKLSDCRRVVLFSYNKETKNIEFRHYLIAVAPVGINKSVKRIIRARIPNLSKLDDISQYVLSGGDYASDSEAEDGPDSRVSINSQEYYRPEKPKLKKRKRNTEEETEKPVHQSAIRLSELGPRMQLQLIKVEEGFYEGKVIFHEFVQKTPEEIQALEEKKKEQARLKQQRREEQQRNVMKKQGIQVDNDEDEEMDEENENDDNEDKDEDVRWYKEEVGEEPTPGELEKDTKEPERKKYHPFHRSNKKLDPSKQENENPKIKKPKNLHKVNQEKPEGTGFKHKEKNGVKLPKKKQKSN